MEFCSKWCSSPEEIKAFRREEDCKYHCPDPDGCSIWDDFKGKVTVHP